MEPKYQFKGFVGPSNKLSAERFDAQRTVNMFMELNPLGQGKSGEAGVLLSTPGLKTLMKLDGGIIRGMFTPSLGGVVYVVAGTRLYKTEDNFATVTFIGFLYTSVGPVKFADNGSAVTVGGSDIMFVDGSYVYKMSQGNEVATYGQVTDPNCFAATSITYQDGYFILNRAGTGYFFISDLNATTFPDLNEALKSGYGDNIVAVISNNRELMLLGAKTTEFWYDSGASALTPFARIDGKFSNVGCVSAATVCKLSDQVYWVGQNEQGNAIVYSNEGGTAMRVSNYAVELSIQSVTADDLANATAWTYQQNGHFFYGISIPNLDTTWVYDASIKFWHERKTTRNGAQGRHLASCLTYSDGNIFAGSYLDGSVFLMDTDTYTDDGQMILRVRASPHLSESLDNIFVSLFQLDCQAGVGKKTGTINEVDPKLTLRVSRDGGQTWGLPTTASLGKIGRWTTRQRWNRLGYGRDFVFEVSCSDPVSVSLLSAWLVVADGNA